MIFPSLPCRLLKGRNRNAVLFLSRRCLFALLLFSSLWALSSQSALSAERAQNPTLIIALPQLTWEEFRRLDDPLIGTLLEQAAVGLMPASSPLDRDPNKTWVTLGAGRAAAGHELTGRPSQPGFSLDISPLREANRKAYTNAEPGFLGERLRAAGYSTAAFGLTPGITNQIPPSFAILADRDGFIDGGALLPGKPTPLGMEVEPELISHTLAESLSRYNVVLLDLVGLERAYLPLILHEALTQTARNSGRLLAFSALTPPTETALQRTAGYLLIWEPEPAATQILSSATTRWLGLVSPVDFAPTILASYDLTDWQSAVSGRVITVRKTSLPLQQLDRLDRMLALQWGLRMTAGRIFAFAMTLCALLALLLLLWHRPALPLLAIPALAISLLPVGLLFASLLGPGQLSQLLVAFLLAILLAWAALRFPRANQGLAFAYLLSALAIVIDTTIGSPLLRQSAFGYSALSGSRYYGIGNEYAGVLAAMSIIGLGGLLEEMANRRTFIFTLAIFILFALGAPSLGANWGSYIAAATAFLALLVIISKQKRRTALFAFFAFLAAAFLPAALDLLRPLVARTHIGLAAEDLLLGRFDALHALVMRKLAMNVRMAKIAGWWWLIGPIGLTAIWSLYRDRSTSRILASSPNLRAGLIAAAVFAAIALFTNDSGIVTCSITAAIIVGSLIFIGGKGR